MKKVPKTGFFSEAFPLIFMLSAVLAVLIFSPGLFFHDALFHFNTAKALSSCVMNEGMLDLSLRERLLPFPNWLAALSYFPLQSLTADQASATVFAAMVLVLVWAVRFKTGSSSKAAMALLAFMSWVFFMGFVGQLWGFVIALFYFLDIKNGRKINLGFLSVILILSWLAHAFAFLLVLVMSWWSLPKKWRWPLVLCGLIATFCFSLFVRLEMEWNTPWLHRGHLMAGGWMVSLPGWGGLCQKILGVVLLWGPWLTMPARQRGLWLLLIFACAAAPNQIGEGLFVNERALAGVALAGVLVGSWSRPVLWFCLSLGFAVCISWASLWKEMSAAFERYEKPLLQMKAEDIFVLDHRAHLKHPTTVNPWRCLGAYQGIGLGAHDLSSYQYTLGYFPVALARHVDLEAYAQRDHDELKRLGVRWHVIYSSNDDEQTLSLQMRDLQLGSSESWHWPLPRPKF